MEYDYEMVLAALRKIRPSAVRILEESCDMIESRELCWELVISLALIAAQAEESIVSVTASLEGLTTTMHEHLTQ